MHKPRNQALTAFARQLRRGMAKEERHLWYDFLRYCRPRFRRQEIIGSYIADFYCHDAKLVVELDGSQHTQEQDIAYDTQRTAYFHTLGIDVIRYYNSDIHQNFLGVCQDLLSVLEQRGIRWEITQ